MGNSLEFIATDLWDAGPLEITVHCPDQVIDTIFSDFCVG